MARSKRHHVVPKFLLANFTDENGQLHLLDKRGPDRVIIPKSPEKAFVQFHAYSTEEVDGSRDDAVEVYLSRLEDRAAPLLRRMIGSARRSRLEPLVADDWDTLNKFTIAQAKRSPDSFTRRPGDFDGEAYFAGLIQRIERDVRPLSEAEKTYFFDKDYVRRVLRNASVEATVGMMPELASVMDATGLIVVHAGHRNRAFIIGSNPVAKLARPEDTKLGSSNVELWLPVASDVALVRCGLPTYQLMRIDEQRWFRNVNTAIAGQSTIIAGRAEALVRSVGAA